MISDNQKTRTISLWPVYFSKLSNERKSWRPKAWLRLTLSKRNQNLSTRIQNFYFFAIVQQKSWDLQLHLITFAIFFAPTYFYKKSLIPLNKVHFCKIAFVLIFVSNNCVLAKNPFVIHFLCQVTMKLKNRGTLKQWQAGSFNRGLTDSNKASMRGALACFCVLKVHSQIKRNTRTKIWPKVRLNPKTDPGCITWN